MANLEINTTHNVNLDYKIVGLGERIVAFLIDALILSAYAFIVNLIALGMGFVFEDKWTVFGLHSLLFLPAMCYTLVMHILFDGKTVGKMLMKIKVVRVNGSPVYWSNYLVRWILRLVDIWIFLSALGILTILFSNRRQRLGDMAADTVVISTKNETRISHTILEEVEEEYAPAFLNVTTLTDKDIRLIKETLQIAEKTSDFKTLKALREKVEGILGTQSALYDVPYIKTVLKDYNHFTQQL